jgi:hypothetical protein
MGIVRRLLALAVVIATASTALAAQEPAPRAFLLFIDDLHLDFRETPRTRALMQRLYRDVAGKGDIWAIATTGASSLNMRATTDLTGLQSAISRVTGNALKPAERVSPTAGDTATEVQHRASKAFTTAADALARMTAAAQGAPLTMLYVSDGYDTRRTTGLEAVVEAASRARATVFAIKPLMVIDAAAAGVGDAEWRAYTEATQSSLQTLAKETGGVAIFSPDDLGLLLERLARP